MSEQSKYLYDFNHDVDITEEEELYSPFFKKALDYIYEWDPIIVMNDLKDIFIIARDHYLTKIGNDSPTKKWALGLEDEIEDNSELGLASRDSILLALSIPYHQLVDDVNFLKEIINIGTIKKR